MKTSLNWLRDYLDLPHPPERIGEILTALGLEVEGQEEWVSVPGELAGVVVGRVLTCGKHPNADKLSLTTVDIGAAAPVQIVCGAPNVAAGQLVPVATVGTTLHPLGGEPFKIKKGKIRGEVSMGMICAEDELGLGDGHDGILVIDGGDYAPGTPASEVFPVVRDTVFEIGLTPNRSDATSHRGVAADLRAYLATHEGYTAPLRTPSYPPAGAGEAARPGSGSTAARPSATSGLPLAVKVEVLAPERAPRYSGLALDGLTVAPSPPWLRHRLAAIGVRPINNVVDATNYVLHDIGQPLHAFDLDRAGAAAGFRVRTLPEGTAFTTLDDEERTLDADDLAICDAADDRPLCIAGVFGGAGSGVTATTRRIFLESAYFEPRGVRRSATRHLLFTDAARTFEKGVDPSGTVDALHRAAELLGAVAGARPASELVDVVAEPILPAEVEVTYDYLAGVAGVVLPEGAIKDILTALGFVIVGDTDDPRGLRVRVPTNRVDVTRPADVAEEVLRVYGYDNVPLPSRVRLAPAVGEYPSAHQLRRRAAEYLIGRGLHEAMGLSLVPGRAYEALEPELVERLVRIHNTSTVELDALRVNLAPTGLQTIAYNQNRQQPDLAFFEFGKGYLRGAADGEPTEYEQLAVWTTGARRPGHWAAGAGAAASAKTSYAHVRGLAEGLLAAVGVRADGERAAEPRPELGGVFAYAQELTLDAAGDGAAAVAAATVGRVAGAYVEYFDTKSDEVYLALVHWGAVARAAAARAGGTVARELTRYPRVSRDLAVVVDKSVTFGRIAELTRGPAGPLARPVELFDVYEDAERLGAGKRSYAIRFAFERLDRTLKDKEVDRAMAAVADALDAQPDMEVRR